MKILTPYETVACKVINTAPLVATYKKFITNIREEDLSYELYQGDPLLYFITGKDEEEKELPILNFPLQIETLKREPAIIIDIRSYVNSVKIKDEFTKLSEVVRDKYAVNFLTLSALLTYRAQFDKAILKPIQSTLLTTFIALCSTSIRKQSFLPPIDALNMEVAIGLYAYSLLNPEVKLYDDIVRVSAIMAGCKYSLPVTNKQIMDAATRLAGAVDQDKYTGINYLKELLYASVPEDTRKNVDINVLYNALTNSWYGPGETTATYVALESMPVFTAMIYAVLSSSMYKKTKIAQIIDSNKKKIDIISFLKYLDGPIITQEFKGFLS